MDEWVKIMLTVVSSVLASSGLWAFVQARFNRKDTTHRMLEALAHDRILHVGGIYLKHGDITVDELENLEMLYGPYKEMGGNGSAKKIMEKIERLPIRHN